MKYVNFYAENFQKVNIGNVIFFKLNIKIIGQKCYDGPILTSGKSVSICIPIIV